MLIKWSEQKTWIMGCFVILAIATVAYIPYHLLSLNGPSGGSWPGLIYGIVGSAMMLFAGLFTARKKVPTWRLGRAEAWMKGHIWLGLLSLPLILMHAGFRFGGALTTALMILFLLIVVSGGFGLLLQRYLPRLMMEQTPAETTYEQIDYVISKLQLEADALVERVCGPLGLETGSEETGASEVSMLATTAARDVIKGEGKVKGKVVKTTVQPSVTVSVEESRLLKDFYLAEVRPFLTPRLSRNTLLARTEKASALFKELRTKLSAALHETVNELETICDERRQLTRQVRLHHWLHGWLFIHIPLSLALLVLAVVHAVIALRY
jgi:hypothetical protein